MGFRGTPCHGVAVAHKGEDGSRTVLGAKKRPCSTLHPPIAAEPFLELEKNMLCDIF